MQTTNRWGRALLRYLGSRRWTSAWGWVFGLLASGCAEKDASRSSSSSGNDTREEIVAPAAGDRAAAKPFFEQAAGLMSRPGNEAEILQDLDRALELDPQFVEARMLRSQMRSRQGPLFDPIGALEDVRKASRLRPEEPGIVIAEATLSFQMGNSSRARELAQQYLVIGQGAGSDSMLGSAHSILGELYLREGKLDPAQQHLSAALAFLPQSAEVLLGLAKVKEERGDFEGALRHLDEARKNQPGFLSARWARLRVLRRLGRAEQAEKEQEVCELLRRLTDSTATEFARDYALQGDLWGQLAGIEPVLEFCLKEARARYLCKDYGAVVELCSRAIGNHPRSFDLWYLLAVAEMARGNAAEARVVLDQVRALVPPLPKEALQALERDLKRIESEAARAGRRG